MMALDLDKLRARFDEHEAFLKKSGDSIPPAPVLRDLDPLTPERCREIGQILQRHMLPAAFGISPAELAAFVQAAKRGVKT